MNTTPRTPEQKAIASITTKQRWQDPEYRRRVAHGQAYSRLKAKRWVQAKRRAA
jgi:hypothetical protein